MAKEIKYRYKVPPCPACDVEGTESWLTDLAAKGLHLSKDGFFLGLAIFEQGKPACVRYRLDAASKKASTMGGDLPEEELLKLAEEYGWEFVAARGQFYIYRAQEPGTRELNTDPQVQALALEEAQKRERAAVVACFLWAILYPLLAIRGTLLLTMFHMGTGFVLLGIALLTWLLCDSIGRAIHLGRLRKRLLAGGALNHRKPWRGHSKWYFAGKALFCLLTVLWLVLFIQKWSDDVMGVGQIPLSEFDETVPFATISDFAPEGDAERENVMGIANTIHRQKDWLAPVVIDWEEITHVKLPDGRRLEGSLYLDYYETLTPWLAREAAREHVLADHGGKRYEKLDAPQVDADYAAAYRDELGFPTVVLQTGNKVLHATFYQTSANYTMELEEWAAILAESIRQ